MERPQSKHEGENLSQRPPVQQSYWRFLAEKLLMVQDEHSTKNPPFFEAKPSSASTQVACTTHQVHEIVADNHMGHSTSTSSTSDFLLPTKGRKPSSTMTKEQRRWSPSSCESTTVETAKMSYRYMVPSATLTDHRWRPNSTQNDLHASFDLDGSERSTVSTGSVDVSPRRPHRSSFLG